MPTHTRDRKLTPDELAILKLARQIHQYDRENSRVDFHPINFEDLDMAKQLQYKEDAKDWLEQGLDEPNVRTSKVINVVD